MTQNPHRRLWPLFLAVLLANAITDRLGAGPIQWAIGDGGNGHYYDLVFTSSGISWHDANTAAVSTTFLGSAGHLVTVTSAAENNFLFTTFGTILAAPGTTDAWIGLTDEVSEGNWQWVTGEAFGYSNWGFGEPNDHPPGEDYAHYWRRDFGSGPSWTWNDQFDVPASQFGYFVEFDGPFSPAAVPEPCSLTLLLIGGVLLFRLFSSPRSSVGS